MQQQSHFLFAHAVLYCAQSRTFVCAVVLARSLVTVNHGVIWRITIDQFVSMPKKRKLLIHLDGMNAERASRKKSSIALDLAEAKSSTLSENDDDDDDDEIPFWPPEDEQDEDNNMPLEESERKALILKWVPNAQSKSKRPHLGVSRFTVWRRKSEMEKREKSMKGQKTLFDHWNIDADARNVDNGEAEPIQSASEKESESDDSRIVLALSVLEKKFKIDASNKQREHSLKSTSKSDFLRLLCVHRFLEALKQDQPYLRASQEIASAFYPSRNREWTGRQIRIWSESFLETHSLPEKNQGRHIKTNSIIADENTQSVCRQWLRSQKAHAISGTSFSEWVKHQLHHELGLPASVEISERTATRWLHLLNYNLGDTSKKGTYLDGHERPDVVEYRTQFLLRMEQYQKRMPIYTGDDMELTIMPELTDDTRPLILVVHDESCFQSNDGGKTGWFDDNHRQIRPKGSGKSLMVSAFLCECHGLLRLPEEQMTHDSEACRDSTHIIRPGANSEGYWTNSDLVRQTKNAMTIFKILHPNSDALFVFDNSANHHAFAPDALVVSRLNLSDGGKNIKSIMRDGWFRNENGDVVTQSFRNAKGQQKGLKTILQERHLWSDGLSMIGTVGWT